MGGGISKKQSDAQRRPPPVVPSQPRMLDNDGWEVGRVEGDEWNHVPYAVICPDERRGRTSSLINHSSMSLDTPSGGAGVGSLCPDGDYLDADIGSLPCSELPPTALSVEVLEVAGLNDLQISGMEDEVEQYCVAVIGTVTRVLAMDNHLREGPDHSKFYGTSVSFPLHDRGELELLGLMMHFSFFMSANSATTEADREIGECTVQLEKGWLFNQGGHTAWLRLVDGSGGGSAGRVKLSFLPDFGRGTVQQQEDTLLNMSAVPHMQNTLLGLSKVQTRSPSPLTASSDEDDAMLTDGSHFPFPPGAGMPSASSRKALISKTGLEVLLEEVKSFNNHVQRMEWLRLVRAQHSFTCVQVLSVLQALRYQHEVVMGCKLFAKSVTDPHNRHTLLQAVQAPNDRAEVAEYLTKVQQRILDKHRRRAQRLASS